MDPSTLDLCPREIGACYSAWQAFEEEKAPLRSSAMSLRVAADDVNTGSRWLAAARDDASLPTLVVNPHRP